MPVYVNNSLNRKLKRVGKTYGEPRSAVEKHDRLFEAICNIPQTSKKYTTRKSPPFPANECCEAIKRGNDGKLYMSVELKNGICRWQKIQRN